MTTIDGYFSQRPMPETMVILEDVEPAKQDPDAELSPEELERVRQQESYDFPEGERTRPPSYRSRRASSSYNGDSEGDEEGVSYARRVQVPAYTPSTPLPPPPPPTYCTCGSVQCIDCLRNGNAYISHRERGCGWKGAKKGKVLKYMCLSTIAMMIFIILLARVYIRKSSSGYYSDRSYQYLQDTFCAGSNPTIEKYSFNVPINSTDPSFLLQQASHESRNGLSQQRININGQVIIRNAEVEEVRNDEILVQVEVRMSDKKLRKDIHVHTVENGVVISSNRTRSSKRHHNKHNGGQYYHNCAYIKATIIVPRHVEMKLHDLRVLTETLNIGMNSNVVFTVDQEAELKSVSGDITKNKIHSASLENTLQARYFTASTISGEIEGPWSVGESASLNSKSGSINVEVFAAEKFIDQAERVSLEIGTISGQIRAQPVLQRKMKTIIPESAKEWVTQVSSVSGDISGAFILGTTLEITSTSGSITAQVYPVVPKDSINGNANFHTDTKSGRTIVDFRQLNLRQYGGDVPHDVTQTVLNFLKKAKRYISGTLDMSDHKPSPLHKHKASALDKVVSVHGINGIHKSISGGLSLSYPNIFEGSVEARSLTGSVTVRGDLQVIEDHGGRIGRTVKAVRGDKSAGSILVETISGNEVISVDFPQSY